MKAADIPATAVAVLRERAELADNNARKASRYVGEEDCVEAYKREAAEWRAVADLMEAVRDRHNGEHFHHPCELCDSLAALDRLITGESDGV